MRTTKAMASATTWLVAIALAIGGSACRKKPPKPVEVVATPEIAGSGLVQFLMATFQRQNGVTMHLQVLPVAEASRLASEKKVQVVITDQSESKLIAGAEARLTGIIAFDDFILLGPRRDPAHVASAKSAVDALRRIANKQARFCTTTDVPHLRRREAELWAAAGIDPKGLRHYSECRGDAEAALRAAAGKGAYTLSDRVVFENMAESLSGRLDLKVLSHGMPHLHDEYQVVLVEHTPRIRRDRDAEWFVQWLMSYQGRESVQNLRVDGIARFSVPNPAPSQ